MLKHVLWVNVCLVGGVFEAGMSDSKWTCWIKSRYVRIEIEMSDPNLICQFPSLHANFESDN